MTSDHKIFNYSSNWLTDTNRSIPHAVKFWVYLVFLIPSMICSVFVLYGFLSNRILRYVLHNHAIIIFLFIGLVYEITIYPWMLHFYYHKSVWKRTSFLCNIWIFFYWELYFSQTILFAWATIERHILVFHDNWVSTRKKRLLVHYLPPIMLALYTLIYHIVVVFFPSCENTFNYYAMICVDLCLIKSFTLYTYHAISHQILPNLVIVVFSIALLLRTCWQKHRMGRSLRWRKNWKMTIQLLFFSTIYFILAAPFVLMNLLYLCGLPSNINLNFIQYAMFLNYCAMLICPIASAFLLPQLRNERNNILRLLHRPTAVAPLR